MTEPLNISIVIPSYNRGSVVEENVAKCLALQPQAKEIILVDDHSDAESEAVLRGLAEAHASIRYIRLPENGGQSVSRSVGLATACGKYIVSLDDDSWFLDNDGLKRVWDRMEALPNCGILAFATFSPGVPAQPAEDRLMLVSDHIACGAAFRTDVLRSTGYHLSFLRATSEEADLSIKVIEQGFDVVLDSLIRVYHDYDPELRPKSSIRRVREMGVRNDLLQVVVYFPLFLGFAVFFKRVISHFIFGLKHGYVWTTVRGYGGFVRLLPSALRKRHPLHVTAVMRYLRLRRKPESYPS